MMAAAALATAFVPAAGNASECSAAPAAETLQMTVEPKRSEAVRGGDIKLLVTVSRGLEGDDQPRIPAEGVQAIVVLRPTWPYMAGEATTAADGTALIQIAVPKRAPLGWLDGYGVAEIQHTPPACGDAAAERADWTGERIVKIRG